MTTKLANIPQGHFFTDDIGIVFRGAIFSPNGRRVAFTAQNRRDRLILDGENFPQRYNEIYEPFSFDSESKNLSFGALIDREFWWIVKEIK